MVKKERTVAGLIDKLAQLAGDLQIDSYTITFRSPDHQALQLPPEVKKGKPKSEIVVTIIAEREIEDDRITEMVRS
jgi:hypothetical protein